MRTEYRGPVRVDEVVVGDLSIKLVRPTEPDRMLDDPDVAVLNQVGDYMPYWAYLWPGTFLLAELLAGQTWNGERAIELGCGLGLPGLVGMARGLAICFSDYDAAPLDFVARSVAENGFDPALFSAAEIDWNEPPLQVYDLIIAADVLYEKRLVPLVAKTLASMLAPNGEAWIADPNRGAAEGFPAVLQPFGLICQSESKEVESREFGRVRGKLHRITRDLESLNG